MTDPKRSAPLNSEQTRVLWRVWLRVKTAEEAQKVLAALGARLGHPIAPTSCEPYWKDPACYVAEFETPAPDGEPPSVIDYLRRLAADLGGPWLFGGPYEFVAGLVEFEGHALQQGARFSVAGLDAAYFDFRYVSPRDA